MPPAIIIWIWFCAYLNCVGWTLSWLHQLNAGGYAVALALGLAAFLWWKMSRTGAKIEPSYSSRPSCDLCFKKFLRRFRKPFPLAFLILAALAFLGGALHPANNYDTLAYRTPRVLHWLAAEQWQWVHTDFPRLNTRTAGFEWLTAPQFLFWHTDHFVFLLNVISFLLLPGRVFAVLTRLGVRPRAAWHWMWLFPTGYGYVLQAGSVVNDLFGALIAFAAIEYALRASRDQNLSQLWTAGLAAALMTAVKAFNIVLLLPWALAALPAFKLLFRRPIASVAVVLLAVSASMLPTSILDAKYCGDWTGAKIEATPISSGHELLRLPVTSANLVLGNLAPPIFPFAQAWEQLIQRVLPENFKQAMVGHFEGSMSRFQLPELQVEESSGLGCGLSLLLLALLLRKVRARAMWPARWFAYATLVPLGAWVGLGVFVLRVGIAGPARYVLPFYLLLAVPFLAGPVAGGIFQLRRWRVAAFAVFAVAGLLLVLSPQRPLWPATSSLRALAAESSANHLLNRVGKVYSTYGERADSFAPVLAVLPPAASPLGYLAFDEPEAALCRPFGSRRLIHLCRTDTPAAIRAQGLQYALVCERTLADHDQMTLAVWLAINQAEVLQSFRLRLRAGQEPYGWALVKFQPLRVATEK